MKNIVALFTCLILFLSLKAQHTDSLTAATGEKIIFRNAAYRNPISLRSYFIPAFLTSYGFFAMKNEDLKEFDYSIREEVWVDQAHKPITIDNYLQYAPAFSVFVLRAAGVPG